MSANRDQHGRFKKGAPSANPRGRPKLGNTTAEVLRTMLDQAKGNRTRREIIADVLLSKAEAGDVPAIRTVLERAEGRSPFTVMGNGCGMFGPSTERDPEKLRVIITNIRRSLPELLKGTDQCHVKN